MFFLQNLQTIDGLFQFCGLQGMIFIFLHNPLRHTSFEVWLQQKKMNMKCHLPGVIQDLFRVYFLHIGKKRHYLGCTACSPNSSPVLLHKLFDFPICKKKYPKWSQVSGISCSFFLLKPYFKWCVILESLDVFLKLLAAGRNSIWLFSLLFQEFGLDLIFEFQIDVGMVQTYFFKQPYIHI